MTTFLNLHVFAAKGFTRNCGCFSSAQQPLPFPTSPLGTTDSCSQDRILLLKLSRSASNYRCFRKPLSGRRTSRTRIPKHRTDLLLPRGDDAMRYTIVLLLLLSGTAASNAGTLMERLRLAQNRTVAECVSNCNSDNFSCARNCGLSGACVAQCTAASAACKNGCNSRSHSDNR